jgi:hypothetical protein
MVSGAPSSRDSSLPIQSPSDLAVTASDLAVVAGFEPAEGPPQALSSSAARDSDPFGYAISNSERWIGDPKASIHSLLHY